MKKKISICFFTIIVIVVLVIVGYIWHTENVKKYEKSIEGMKVTLIGGSNMKENGDVNSCGYVIRSKNGELILVDGGRKIDAEIVYNYINKFGNGTVKYWYITHLHEDHIGALIELLNNENYNINIENLCYAVNDKEWYISKNQRGLDYELAFFNSLENSKIKNRIECKKGQIIESDNLKCEIIRITNPDLKNTDIGNDCSMVFKFTATDVNKDMIFLGDAFVRTSEELLKEDCINKLPSYAVQMAHHGQNGVEKEIYEKIHPTLCFFNCPEWLYNNDNGGGYNSGSWKSIEVRSWMEEMNTTNFVAFEGDQTIRFTKEGYEICEE